MYFPQFDSILPNEIKKRSNESLKFITNFTPHLWKYNLAFTEMVNLLSILTTESFY